MPGPERRAAGVPGAADLVEEYQAWLAVDGRDSRCYLDAAWAFLGRWGDPQAFAAEPLHVQVTLTASQRPFLTFLMVTGRCRPGWDYLARRKIGGLLAQAARGPMAADLRTFAAAATDLDYAGRTVKRASERVVVRALIQTGRGLSGLREQDLDALGEQFAAHAREKGTTRGWAPDRALLSTARRVLFHLGVLTGPPVDPRRRGGLAGYCSGVDEPLRTLFLAYCDVAGATRAPATRTAIAGHLASFGRFLASCDPPVTDLSTLDRRTHIEPWLTAVAASRTTSGAPASVGHRRGQILTVRAFLADITEWGWPAAPARALVFTRDVPRMPRPLPRYLPPDPDRALIEALETLSRNGPSPAARLHADALLLLRSTGLRIGELLDLEADCVHHIDGHGAWLKVPLGKLATERLVPLDEATLPVLDRIHARRTPGRALPHPRTGRPAHFLLVHQGRRVSMQALREELARTARAAGIDHVTPHGLRHTYATSLVNSGVPLQALMHLLGHTSATMSLRYGHLFDATVRDEYDRAMAHTRAQPDPDPATHEPVTTARPALGTLPPLEQITGATPWLHANAIKTRLAGGFCLRAPAQGPCDYAHVCEHCPAYRTSPDHLPVLHAQRDDTAALAHDATERGWTAEAQRHQRLVHRLDQLIADTRTADQERA